MEALEARQDAILTRLEELKEQVKAYKKSLGLSDLPPPKNECYHNQKLKE